MPPAAIPIATGIISGIVNQAGKGGSAGNTYHADPYSQTSDYDPNKFEYGGHAGAAEDAVARQNALSNASYGDTARYSANAQGLAGRGGSFLDQSQDARTQQQQVAAMTLARAQGLTPSIAQMQAQRDMQAAIAAQGARAASARGPAALALAQQGAANNIANASGAISGQAQINAANERLAAEQAAAAQYGNIRQGDYVGANQAYGASAQQGQLGVGYGNLGLGQDTLGHQIRQGQLDAGIRQQGILANSRGQADVINSGLRSEQVGRNDKIFDDTMGYIGKGLQAGGLGGGGGGGGGASNGGVKPPGG